MPNDQVEQPPETRPSFSTSLFVGENTSFPAYQGELMLGHGLKYKVIARSGSGMILEVVKDGNAR